MKNYEWLVKNGYKFSEVNYCFSANHKAVDFYIDGELIGKAAGKSYLEAFTEWLDMEHTEQILDEVERQYLSSVIKPFKKRAVFVRKDFHNGLDGNKYEQIVIRVKSAMPNSFADIELPFFKEGTMYKGMKIYREYTMKELGL